MDIGDLVRRRRVAHGLSQARLARRAGTTQAVVSRIERGSVSPTLATVRALLDSLGEELRINASPREPETDVSLLTAYRALPPEERLRRGIDWNEFAGEVARAGAKARRT